ncbi:glucosaminidase domain-containing protein [Colwellia sp. 4_MG-2023]|uniref:glucosaminidase domain-containing protein n=1 Tax=unclassified Colwellia TaxID=196834 RepID=UPI001C0A514E|nr:MULTISPECIES: glucosaminidase domain-containing protein [unclassified Colwellia]MBU2923321.1 glucosaminidase domain-containing protein [Colwellia sp. C2M11]MDO6507950.1 glucosaminidase domain-containing protein [Colwellia sp. 5_MG-2023]MDO6556690.1 glucosaminidase domain-containing protein [Colwellia sp. 4_MG-2023]MDO6653692.1 glucosaminidase domain-containing protein [Colwellia sp. 3_MG-2023]MDO6666503.1 glucosaminidase domain-containing protein [Colwellia sp. 2_MG-2023]
MNKAFDNKRISILLAVLVLLLTLVITLYSHEPKRPNFEEYAAGTERKSAFFNYFIPLIDEKNINIKKTRKQLLLWSENRNNISWWDKRKIADIAIQYRVTDATIDDDIFWQKLLKRVDVLPPSLVLAQAANESAWGTSRFAQLGNNFFGQWCFEKGCGLIPNKRDSGKSHEVAAFDSPQQSLESYMNNLNSHPAYQSLRNIRAQQRADKQPITGLVLAEGLSRYSERGMEYITELRAMIKFNKLTQYDQSQDIQ